MELKLTVSWPASLVVVTAQWEADVQVWIMNDTVWLLRAAFARAE